MDNTKGWVLVIGILLLLGIAALSVLWLMYSSIQRTIEPVQSVSGELSTRVAQVLNPTPTVLPDPVSIIRDVRSLARLETIQYTIEKVITAETGQGTFGALFGDKLIFVAHGQVLAGVDLAKLGADDLVVQNNVLYVRLPAPEIFIASVDNDKSYVYDRDTGLLTKGDVNLETSARRVAESEIAKAALEDGVLDHARDNAENYLYRLFTQMGYPDVIFVHDNEEMPAPATPLPPQGVPLATPTF